MMIPSVFKFKRSEEAEDEFMECYVVQYIIRAGRLPNGFADAPEVAHCAAVNAQTGSFFDAPATSFNAVFPDEPAEKGKVIDINGR